MHKIFEFIKNNYFIKALFFGILSNLLYISSNTTISYIAMVLLLPWFLFLLLSVKKDTKFFSILSSLLIIINVLVPYDTINSLTQEKEAYVQSNKEFNESNKELKDANQSWQDQQKEFTDITSKYDDCLSKYSNAMNSINKTKYGSLQELQNLNLKIVQTVSNYINCSNDLFSGKNKTIFIRNSSPSK